MGYNMPYMRARLLFRQKHVYADGSIVELKAWAVPSSRATPEGFKYSMVYIDRHGRRLLGYDNAEGKGHHRHAGVDESPVEFGTIEALAERFLAEVSAIRRRLA